MSLPLLPIELKAHTAACAVTPKDIGHLDVPRPRNLPFDPRVFWTLSPRKDVITLAAFSRYWFSLTVCRRFAAELSAVTRGISPLFKGWLLLSLPLRQIRFARLPHLFNLGLVIPCRGSEAEALLLSPQDWSA